MTDWRFQMYKEAIETKEREIEIERKIMHSSEHVSDYWKHLNKLEKLQQEKWIWEQMAREKGYYIVD